MTPEETKILKRVGGVFAATIAIIALGGIVWYCLALLREINAGNAEVRRATAERMEFHGGPQSAVKTQPGRPAKPAMTISAAQLEKAYDSNEIAADDKYLGAFVEISGQISDVTRDRAAEAYVALGSGKEQARCYIDASAMQAATKLAVGQSVVLSGYVAGRALQIQSTNGPIRLRTPVITACRIVQIAVPAASPPKPPRPAGYEYYTHKEIDTDPAPPVKYVAPPVNREENPQGRPRMVRKPKAIEPGN